MFFRLIFCWLFDKIFPINIKLFRFPLAMKTFSRISPSKVTLQSIEYNKLLIWQSLNN